MGYSEDSPVVRTLERLWVQVLVMVRTFRKTCARPIIYQYTKIKYHSNIAELQEYVDLLRRGNHKPSMHRDMYDMIMSMVTCQYL